MLWNDRWFLGDGSVLHLSGNWGILVCCGLKAFMDTFSRKWFNGVVHSMYQQ
jgi:hypothetical protein